MMVYVDYRPMLPKAILKKMIELAQKSDAKVILLGMKIPPNYGVAYSKKFENAFSELAKKYQLPFIPFFLENIITDLKLLQEDELHPTAEAQPLLLKSVLPIINAEIQQKVL